MATKRETAGHDALALLAAEHNEIDQLGRAFEQRPKTADPAEAGKLALRLCHAVALHAAIKDDVFYPAAHAVVPADRRALVDGAGREQEAIGRLIERIEQTPADAPGFPSLVADMLDRMRRLAALEEKELFPLLRHSGLDLRGTGERMAARGAELATQPLDRGTIARARRVMGGRI